MIMFDHPLNDCINVLASQPLCNSLTQYNIQKSICGWPQESTYSTFKWRLGQRDLVTSNCTRQQKEMCVCVGVYIVTSVLSCMFNAIWHTMCLYKTSSFSLDHYCIDFAFKWVSNALCMRPHPGYFDFILGHWESVGMCYTFHVQLMQTPFSRLTPRVSTVREVHIGQLLKTTAACFFASACLVILFSALFSFLYNFNSPASALGVGKSHAWAIQCWQDKAGNLTKHSSCTSSAVIKHTVLLLIVNPPTDHSLSYLCRVIYI